MVKMIKKLFAISLLLTTSLLPSMTNTAFAAEAECQNEEASAAVFTGFRIADLRAGAVVDLRFFARCGENDRAGFRRLCAALLADEAFDGFVGTGEAVMIDEILPDRHGVATDRQSLLDELAVGLASAGGGGGVGGHRIGRFCHLFGGGVGAGVGGHLIGRFWWRAFAPGSGGTQRDSGGLQVGGCGFAANSGLFLDATQGPA